MPRTIRTLTLMLGLLASLVSPAAAEVAQDVASASSLLGRAEANLDLGPLTEAPKTDAPNPLSADRSRGEDRDAAVAVAIDGWKVPEEDAEILAVRIPSESWTRETKWTDSNGTWYFVDFSTLQGRLLVADREHPDRMIDRVVDVKKDHQRIGIPLRSLSK